MEWQNIVNLEELKFKQSKAPKPYLHARARPCEHFGAEKLGFNITTIHSGQFSCPYHFHHSEEELFLILEGAATLRQANKYRKVRKGDLIFFRPGPEGSHQLYNHTNKVCKILAISSRDAEDTVEYPDSNKKYCVKLKKVFQAGQEVEYLKDEENPARLWPPELIRSEAKHPTPEMNE